MLTALMDWLDDRTGYRQLTEEALYENIPGGSRWIFVTGSMLTFAFVAQLITGLFLWMFFSAGSQNAWESVYWIQHEMQGGWLLRGVHHYMAQAMVVLLPLHMLQVVVCKAYVAPREINYWLGLVLMLLTLAFGLTGYLLPWDQKGYWATKVATELMSLPPGGAHIQKLAVGGSEYGHYTLTRFFAMHAGVLPLLFVIVLGLHVAMFRRHGITAERFETRADEYFWPQQVFKDAFACLLLLIAVVAVTVYKQGAELGPPAEPTEAYGAARPEWYYLFLFQLLKKFTNEFVGAIIVPGLVMGFLFALPLIARIKYGHVVNVVVILCLGISICYLTYEAIDHDQFSERYAAPDGTDELYRERHEASVKFLEAREQAEHDYERVKDLVSFYGIPKKGALAGLVQQDPEIQGPRIFKRSCASCHSYLDKEEHGIAGPLPPEDENGSPIPDPDPYGAPNLYGFASRDWIRGFLNHEGILTDSYFGLTSHTEAEMAMFVTSELSELDEAQAKSLADIVIALSAEARLVDQHADDQQAADDGSLSRGRTALTEAISDQACTDCHNFGDEGDGGYAPDLTGYGSYEWLHGFISDPNHERFYGQVENDRMPAFGQELSPHEIDMLVRWIRGDDRNLELKKEIENARPNSDNANATDNAPDSEDEANN